MDLYTCSTAYQLMNAVILASQRQEKADVMFTSQSLANHCNMELLRKKGIFHRIYVWDKISSRFSCFSHSRMQYVGNLFKKACIYFRPKAMYKTMPNREMSYQRLLIGYADYPAQCIYYYFKKKGASLIFYDEGTYTYEFLSIHPSLFRKAVSYMIFGSWIMDECTEVYAKRPSQVNCGKYKNMPVKQLCQSSRETDKVLMELFYGSYEDARLFERKVIYFDQNIDRAEIRKMLLKLADVVSGVIGKEELLVKLHPMSGELAAYSSELTTYCSRVPFEVLMNTCHMGDKILISLFSTACFSPKYILDEEPYVIFLYKIMKFDTYIEFNAQFLHGVENLRRSYTKPNRIIIPETTEEMMEELKRIKEAKGW